MDNTVIQGRLVDLDQMAIYGASVTIHKGCIQEIRKLKRTSGPFIIPGFIDAHIHIESSMLPPAEFARLAVIHGTVASVSDPHEIGNVMGVEGVEYMIENSRLVNFKYYFGAPSCVPATPFETAGAEIDAQAIDYLLSKPEIRYLAEMMNWPGVINNDPQVMEKIAIARKHGKPVDGHAPGLRGDALRKYAAAGISTDHECFSLDEALEKLSLGMHILIREGSAARNFNALIPLLPEYADRVMFCSDDLHPDNLVKGHINLLVQRAVASGLDPLTVLQVACKNPAIHYGLNVGLLKEQDPADLVVVKDLKNFRVLQTFIEGQKVAENGESLIPRKSSPTPNKFFTGFKKTREMRVKPGGQNLRVIVAEDCQLITRKEIIPIDINGRYVTTDLNRDILKMVVVNRYAEAPPAVAFVKNFGFKKGAIASSVAHDSHNIIAIGVDDQSICEAVNQIIAHRGGVAAVSGQEKAILPLPIAGLMSDKDGYLVAAKYTEVDTMAKSLGSKLQSPFMTLSFMALLVIPELKLSDQGLFDGENFQFISLFE